MGRIPNLLPLEVRPSEAGARQDPTARPRSFVGENVKHPNNSAGDVCCSSSPSSRDADPASVLGHVKSPTAPVRAAAFAPAAPTTSHTDAFPTPANLAPYDPHTPEQNPASTHSSPFPLPSDSGSISTPTTATSSSPPRPPYLLIHEPTSTSLPPLPQLLLAPSSSPTPQPPASGSNSPANGTAALLARISHRSFSLTGSPLHLPQDPTATAPKLPPSPSQALSGSALARVALNTCTSAEQQLRELLERVPSVSGASPCGSPALVGVQQFSMAPQSPLTPPRRLRLPSQTAVQGGPTPRTEPRMPRIALAPAAALAAADNKPGLGQHFEQAFGRGHGHGLPSTCSGQWAGGGSSSNNSNTYNGGKNYQYNQSQNNLASLLDARQLLPVQHAPGSGGNMSYTNHNNHHNNHNGVRHSLDQPRSTSGATASGAAESSAGAAAHSSPGYGGGATAPGSAHGARRVTLDGEGVVAADEAGVVQSLSSPLSEPKMGQRRNLAALMRCAAETLGGGQEAKGVAWASGADGPMLPRPSHGPLGCGCNASNLALKAITEMQSRDEFSLVAAARQRQQLQAQWGISNGSGGGGTSAHRHSIPVGAVGMSSLTPQMSYDEGADGASASLPAVPVSTRISASLLLPVLPARTSCPELLSTADITTSMVESMSGVYSPPPTHTHLLQAPQQRQPPIATTASPHVLTSTSFARVTGEGTDAGDSLLPRSIHSLAPRLSGGGSGGGEGGGGGAGSVNQGAPPGSFLPSVTSPHSGLSAAAATAGGGPGSRSFHTSAGGTAAVSNRGGSSAPPAAGAARHAAAEATEFAATAAESAAALAAVRALATRFGTVAVDARAADMEEYDTALRERRRKMQEALQAANPAAYREEAAAAAEAAYRAMSERAQLRLRKLVEEATTEEAPVRKLEVALRDLCSQRPFFLPPVITRTKLERTHAVEGPKPKTIEWNVDESAFAARKKECESHSVYDTEKVRNQQLNLDWKRVVAKARFRRMVARGDSGVKLDGQSLDEELAEVREELFKHGDFIRAAFLYYSMMSGGPSMSSSDVHQISASAWLAFCNDAGIISKGGCTAMDMQNIFVAVNFEEESETAEADANDDDAMVRFEFMEGLVRAAFAKYIVTKRMDDASDALAAFMEDVTSSPTLPAEVRNDPNEFRRTRFYGPDIEEVVKEYQDIFTAMYKLYKARDRSKYFWPEHFMAFLEANQLLGPATGVYRREAKLIYAWSQALVTDELRRRQRAVSLTYWDFVEAVARLADLISPPDKEEITQYFLTTGNQLPEPDRIVYEYYRLLQQQIQPTTDTPGLPRRPSAGLGSAPTRHLSVKLRLLTECLTASLREAWGGGDMKDVAAKVLRTANYLCGGIEMG